MLGGFPTRVLPRARENAPVLGVRRFRVGAPALPRIAFRLRSGIYHRLMEDWLVWLIVAVIFGIGEIATLGFFLAPFAGGAAVAAVVSAAGMPFVGALAVFLVISIVLLGALRPIARSHRRRPPLLRTGTAALVGKPATVLERIATTRASDACGSTARCGPRGRTWTTRPTRPAPACRWSRYGAPRRS